MAIREIIKPDSETYMLKIPKKYLHREIEVIFLPVFSAERKFRQTKVPKDFDPILYHGAAKCTQDEIDHYLQNARDEWQLG